MTKREVSKIVRAQEAMEGAGVRIRRSLGSPALDYLDPFLLLDEFKSDDGSDYIAGFPDHPHRGFETVTYMLAGAMRHEDHKGNRGELGPGSVQWMTAGRGIIHSEMPMQEDGLMWGFQLWVNLPAKDKMTEPRYQDIAADRIPMVETASGTRVRLVAGEVAGAIGPVEGIATAPVYVDVEVPENSEYELCVPPEHNGFVYVFEGEGVIGTETLTPGELGVLAPIDTADADTVRFATKESSLRALLIAAKPLEEPMARYGPFVMNTREEIHQAFEDYKRGTFLG
ncbi:MAG: pirin family protein [Acidobacteriota bacterium]|nr:MAG: pirin family protein [Acidobacteriota bacterium]